MSDHVPTGLDPVLERILRRLDDASERGHEQVLTLTSIEGATDYALGRPRDRNPYATDFQPCWDQWLAGWLLAEALFPPLRLRRERDYAHRSGWSE